MNDTTTQGLPVQPTLQVGQIVPGQNYREHYDAKALDELREQVKAAGGIKSPIMVRPHPTKDGLWEIVYGHRRWMVAGEEYGQTYDMPVTIEDLSDAEARALGIIENKGRDNPSAIEEAKGAADLLPVAPGLTPDVFGESMHDAAHLDQSLVLHRGFKGSGLPLIRMTEKAVQPRCIPRDRIAPVSPWCRPHA